MNKSRRNFLGLLGTAPIVAAAATVCASAPVAEPEPGPVRISDAERAREMFRDEWYQFETGDELERAISFVFPNEREMIACRTQPYDHGRLARQLSGPTKGLYVLVGMNWRPVMTSVDVYSGRATLHWDGGRA